MTKLSPNLHNPARDRTLYVWVGTLASAAVFTVIGLVLAGYEIRNPITVAVLVVVAIVVERATVPFPGGELSAGSLIFVFAAVALGPLPAAIVAAAGLLVDLPRRDTSQPILRWATWTSLRVLEGVSASFAALAVAHFAGGGLLGTFAMVLAAFTAETATGLVFGPVAPAIRGANTYWAMAATFAPPLVGSLPLYAPMVAVLVYSYETVSSWSVALFLVPAIAAQRLHLLYRKQRETVQALADANGRLSSANLSFATALVATLDARDQYTAGHSAAVAIYARDIAGRMGLSAGEQELAHLCGLVHDIGKIGLPAGLLEKPGALTLDERRQMERHSEIGERILRNVDDYAVIAEIVRHHHERVDGNGYPDNLVGDTIPLLARIIAVADAYNAMTSDRPYRDAMPSRVARLRLAQAVESQFDTAVVAAFEAILTAATEGYRLGADPEFVLTHDSVSEFTPESTRELNEELRLGIGRVAAIAT